MKRIAMAAALLFTIACTHGNDPSPLPTIGTCAALEVLVGCDGNTWPECDASCPPLDYSAITTEAVCNGSTSIQCNCVTGECHPCKLFDTCTCDAPGTACGN